MNRIEPRGLHQQAAGPATPATVGRLEPSRLVESVFAPVHADKKALRRLLAARENLLNLPSRSSSPAATSNVLANMRMFCEIDPTATQVRRLFSPDSGSAILARTLTKGSPQDTPVSRTPAKVERNTLNDRLAGFNILMNPSTLLAPDANVATISNHPARPKWSGMPSVLYTVPLEQGQAEIGKIDRFRKSFGNVQSFASNHGFTKDFEAMVDSGEHSHAEQLDFFGEQETIRNNLKGEDDFRTMPKSLPELRQQILRFQTHQKHRLSNGQSRPDHPDAKSILYPDGSLPHNEVVARLYLWDSVGVDVGADVKEGLSAAIELQVARESLRLELQSQRTSHPLFDSFLRQQCSVGADNTTLNLGQTNARYGNLTDADKNDVLTHVLQKLQEPIALCNYAPASSSIRGLCDSEVTGTDLLDALDQVIKARTGIDNPRQGPAKATENRIRAQR